ncbi:unannotated protein [freshwater metagenome]|uniref:Unannotated protein n=1 Tax=freshwater metagenome TaxID=449393 RepID=A0A6J5ZK78_9ZZZZ
MQVHGKLWLRRKIAFFLFISSFSMALGSPAIASTYTETFGASCFTLSTGITITYNGNNLTSSGVARYSSEYAGMGAMAGCGVTLQSITANVVTTFPSATRPSSVSLNAAAVNGTQTVIINYSDGSTANWLIPDTVNPSYPNYVGNFTFTGNGKAIVSLLFTPANNPDYWIFDNLSWTVATPDTTAPTFTSSSSFSAAENIATSATAATIQVSESATVTISSGADAARFNITRTETNTAIIKFNASPDFEAPADVGGNNVYEITLTATDDAANAGTQSITITVTNVVDTSSFNSLSLAGSATTAAFRTAVVITANVTVASRVTFKVNGKILPGCKNKSTSGSSPNIIATCTWKPSIRGNVSLTAGAVPNGAGISSVTSTPVSIMVGNRTGSR